MIYLKLRTLVICFVMLFGVTASYKVAIFVPRISGSQIIWNYRVAEVLQKAGHEVTLVEMSYGLIETGKHTVPDGVQRWTISSENVKATAKQYAEEVLTVLYQDYGMFSKIYRKMVSFIGRMMVQSCEGAAARYFMKQQKNYAKNKEFLQRLKEAKFDIAFADITGLCSIGLIHAGNIPTWIWMNSGPMVDFVADISGAPSPSSYVPPVLGNNNDRMTFFQRVQSFLSWSITPFLFRKYVGTAETELFRKYVDPNFPHLVDLAASVPLVMVNSDEMYAMTRPILHKIIYVGGLGMKKKAAKPLTGEFKKIADKASNIIVFTFGSIANATLMPATWKEAFISSFEKFPEVEFFMRYDGTDLKEKMPKNLHIYKWLPQTDLLNLEKTRALITHGGYNSLQEAINSATPVIAIPLFGDQPSNAKTAAKNHFGIALGKSEINKETVTNAIRKILYDESYLKSISKMREMIENKPYTAEDTLVRWTEFAAKFKDLSNLTPYSINLNFVEYYCIDVVLFLATVLLLILFVAYKLMYFIFIKPLQKIKVKSKKE